MRSMLRGFLPPVPPRLDCGSGNTVSCGFGGSALTAAIAAAMLGGTNDGTYLPPGFLAEELAAGR